MGLLSSNSAPSCEGNCAREYVTPRMARLCAPLPSSPKRRSITSRFRGVFISTWSISMRKVLECLSQNRNEPIQRVHGDVGPDSQFVFRKLAPIHPARPEAEALGACNVPEIRRYEGDRVVGYG